MPDSDPQQLLDAAQAARGKAYAPYSKFMVGAAVRTIAGAIYTGANVENVSYGLSLCAERVAVAAAVAAGHREITAVAVASTGAVTPCGACRQFLAEFGEDMAVLLLDPAQPQSMRETTLGELLPDKFQRS